MNTTKIETVPLEQLKRSPFNPQTRTENVTKLAKEIDEQGQLIPIVAVEFPNGDLVIADGNRRKEALEQLGRDEARVLVQRASDGDSQRLLEELFVTLNQGTKAFNGRDKLNAALQGGPTFDANIKSAKLQLETLFPDEAERFMLVNKEVTTTVLNVAKKSTKYVLEGSGIGEGTPTFNKRVRNHILYLLRNNVQQYVISYMRLGFDREALKKAIDNNRPPPRVSSPRLIDSWVK